MEQRNTTGRSALHKVQRALGYAIFAGGLGGWLISLF